MKKKERIKVQKKRNWIELKKWCLNKSKDLNKKKEKCNKGNYLQKNRQK